ncbi:thioredoxin family protein [Actinobacteria bacterium YIM 96077]|uniref:Thioredoxin family protein n=1 Tax=Phytoactinopolyspora halophila TaxID=1981511 RepID=A0A329QZP1_9ACTN|nr:thioredoxin family protein [Phytoactinopolyspora halophila]AYY11693.1 thioredoxin family protein [Actinobacteria bacterium YIM 96077]RAW17874.1 thioredoxin family protein [Phytoactinopolyspora halophila]
MAVESREITIGTPAPDFVLKSADGKEYSLRSFADAQALLVAFVCNHCPYVKHIESVFGELTSEYAKKGVATVAICTNDADAYPDDGPSYLREQAERAGWEFPYLVDEDQTVGLAYGAACTPDLFVFDAERKLAYHGAFDESTPGNNKPVTGELLRAALDQILAGEAVPTPHRPSVGCSIKWRADIEAQSWS